MNINQQTAVRRLPLERSAVSHRRGGRGEGWERAGGEVGTEGARVDRARVASTGSRRVHIHDVNEPPSNV